MATRPVLEMTTERPWTKGIPLHRLPPKIHTFFMNVTGATGTAAPGPDQPSTRDRQRKEGTREDGEEEVGGGEVDEEDVGDEAGPLPVQDRRYQPQVPSKPP